MFLFLPVGGRHPGAVSESLQHRLRVTVGPLHRRRAAAAGPAAACSGPDRGRQYLEYSTMICGYSTIS